MTPSRLAQFETKVERVTESGCWVWVAALNRCGYGRFDLHDGTRASLAHRVSYEHHRGQIPAGLQLAPVPRALLRAPLAPGAGHIRRQYAARCTGDEVAL